jgi:hypothetical protein
MVNRNFKLPCGAKAWNRRSTTGHMIGARPRVWEAMDG